MHTQYDVPYAKKGLLWVNVTVHYLFLLSYFMTPSSFLTFHFYTFRVYAVVSFFCECTFINPPVFSTNELILLYTDPTKIFSSRNIKAFNGFIFFFLESVGKFLLSLICHCTFIVFFFLCFDSKTHIDYCHADN